MRISRRIVLAFTTVTLIPIIVISAVSTWTILGVSNDNAALAASALEDEEVANLRRVSDDVASFIDERIQSYYDGVYVMEDYCEALFNGRLNATPQYSYFWDPFLEYAHSAKVVPGLHSESSYSSDYISFDVSCYYMPRDRYPTPGDPFTLDTRTEYFLNVSSNMDNVFRALHDANSDYIWLYMTFNPSLCPSHLMRNYPFDKLDYFLSDDGDYDPSSENWYLNAASIAVDNTSIAFTPPYGDPSTGLVISMGRPVYFDNGTMIGVVSADVTLATVNSKVLDVQVLDRGYAYLLDGSGHVVAHPYFTTESQSILDLEFAPTDTEGRNQFSTALPTLLSQNSSQTYFTKGGERWLLTSSRVESTGFVLVVVVPADEVVAPAQAMLQQVVRGTSTLLMALGAVLVVVGTVVAGVSFRRARAVVEPIREMTHMVQKMSRQDFTRGVTATGAMFEEVGSTVDALLSFQEACRFGNAAFVRGDLNRALSNYMNLLEISERLGIEVGQQTMCLNIGNVYRQRGDHGNALKYYERALEIAQRLLQQSKEEGRDERDAMLRIASVYHNMALVKMDLNEYDEALKLLEDAQAIDMSLNNTGGLARRHDATGLILMRQGRHSEALSHFEEAKRIAEADDNNRSLAYIHFHMGELFVAKGQWRDAEHSFRECMRLGNLTEEYPLVVLAMRELADVLDMLDEPSHEVRREAERLYRSIQYKKSVVFVIDYSGSMNAQRRILAAIRGAQEILDSKVNPQDEVGITIFNDRYQEVLPLTRRGEYDDPRENPIWRALDGLRRPNGATAFYDALGHALEQLDSLESSEHRWIIALTDGQDNSSEKYSLDYLEGIFTERDRQKKRNRRTVENFVRNRHLDVFLIIIGVGEELRMPVDKKVISPTTGERMTFEELLQSVCENVPQGQYISVVDTADVKSDIENAFKEAAVLMAQLEVGGSTVDY